MPRRTRSSARACLVALALPLISGASREPVAQAAPGTLPANTTAKAKVETPAASAAPVVAKPVAPPLPLSIAVVTADGKTSQTGAWIAAQIAEAQRIYNEFGVSFRKAEVRRIGPRFAKLETRADRDALATQLQPGVINVFVVASLRDVDDPRLYRMGVHWAPKGDLKKQYVIVAASARKTTMAHEIGHYFGLQHSQVPDNLMSYSRTGAEVFLNVTQKQKVITNAKVYVARKDLIP